MDIFDALRMYMQHFDGYLVGLVKHQMLDITLSGSSVKFYILMLENYFTFEHYFNLFYEP